MSRLSLACSQTPAECCLVSDPLGAQALVARCRLEAVPGGGNIAAAEVGEEVEVVIVVAR
jgi:hypothetical protein